MSDKTNIGIRCLFPAQIEKAGDEPLRKVLRQLRGWPVVTDKWQAASWTLEETLANMRGIYNAPILIDSWVGADDKNSTANILQVRGFIPFKIYLLLRF